MKRFLIIEIHKMYDVCEYRARIFDYEYNNVAELDFTATTKIEIEKYLYAAFKEMFGDTWYRRRIYKHSIREHLVYAD